MSKKILAISSSLNPGSVSRVALKAFDAPLKKLDATYTLIDLADSEWALPFFDPKRTTKPEAYLKIKDMLLESDAVILASPDYHGSISGVMKNFLDYFWGELTGRLFGYVCASHEKGLTVMDQMRTSIRQCYGWSLPYGLSLSEADLDEERTCVSNPKTLSRIQLMAYDLVVYGPLLSERFSSDKGQAEKGFAAHYKS